MAVAFSVPGREWAAKLTGGGYKQVTSAGTAVQITSTKTPIGGVIIQALPGNTGDVTIGASTVVGASGATHIGINLVKGDSIYLPIRDLSLIWVDAVTTNDAIYYQPIS
jgi:hypothetical protein